MFWRTLRNYTEPFKSRHEARKVPLRLGYKENTLEDIERTLSYLMGERPVEVYSITLDLRTRDRPLPEAIVKGVENVARSAARHSLLYPPLGIWSIKMNLELETYSNLRDYRRQCGFRLLEFLTMGEVAENMGTEWIQYDTKCGVCPLVYEWAVVLFRGYSVLKCPAEWWVTYWEKVIALAGETPCEEEVLNREGIWDRVSRELEPKCPGCYEVVQKEYLRFRDKILSKVTKIINKVELQIKLWP